MEELRFYQETGSVLTNKEFQILLGDDGIHGFANDARWGMMPIVNIPYNSESDTLKHIKRVNELLLFAAQDLIKRAMNHDDSKLEEPEKSKFDEMTPKLKGLTYGSDEYKASLAELGVALKHHYENNSHHPEHYENGIDDMDLLDLIEMFFDWCAASERHANGNIYTSITQNEGRFGMSEQLVHVFQNTAKRYYRKNEKFSL